MFRSQQSQGPAEIHLQQAGLHFRPGDEVVSFVARNLEPYRGFHRFMRALPLLQQLFRVCACHVYLTDPFVLSWSLLEAMACGAVVIGSATPPVQDVILDGVNGHLVDFFDAEALARRIAAVLADPASQQPLRAEARRHVVERFDLQTVCLPQQLALVDRLLG